MYTCPTSPPTGQSESPPQTLHQAYRRSSGKSSSTSSPGPWEQAIACVTALPELSLAVQLSFWPTQFYPSMVTELTSEKAREA